MKSVFQGRIAKAFADLRKQGFVAKMNHACCQNCGWAAIDEDEDNAVFFHAQDYDSYLEEGELYLAWRGDSKAICTAIRDQGLIAEHDGSENNRILVKDRIH